jgi:hypothetical protein
MTLHHVLQRLKLHKVQERVPNRIKLGASNFTGTFLHFEAIIWLENLKICYVQLITPCVSATKANWLTGVIDPGCKKYAKQR